MICKAVDDMSWGKASVVIVLIVVLLNVPFYSASLQAQPYSEHHNESSDKASLKPQVLPAIVISALVLVKVYKEVKTTLLLVTEATQKISNGADVCESIAEAIIKWILGKIADHFVPGTEVEWNVALMRYAEEKLFLNLTNITTKEILNLILGENFAKPICDFVKTKWEEGKDLFKILKKGFQKYKNEVGDVLKQRLGEVEQTARLPQVSILNGTVSVSPWSGLPGTRFIVSWSGFPPGSTVISHLQLIRPLSGTSAGKREFADQTFTVDSSGSYISYIESTNFEPGLYEIWGTYGNYASETNHDTFRIEGTATQPPPTPNPPLPSPSCKASPKIAVKPKSGVPGTPFTVKWTGFSDNGTLISHLQKPDGSEYPTKNFTVDSRGKAEFVIDSNSFTSGQYNLWAEDTCTGKRTKTVSFTIKGSASPPVQPPPQTCPPGTIGAPPNCQPIQQQNRSPIVSLTYSPENPTLNDTISVKAIASDPDGDLLTYEWYEDGDRLLGFETASSIGIVSARIGTHTIKVRVYDGKGGVAEASISFTVGESTGQPPSPGPGPSPPPQPIDSDNDGIPDNQDQCPYQWGPAPTGCPVATQPLPSINQPPWAQISVFPTTVNVGEQVTVQVVAYGDPENQPLVFDYDFGDGTIIPSPAAGENHSYSSPGTYSVRAKVRDTQGAFSYTNSVTVTVMGSSLPPPSFPPFPPSPPSTPTPQSPVARFTMGGESLFEGYKAASENETLYLGYDQYESGVRVDFSAGNSFDPDGTIVKYEWFINGTPVSNSRDFSFVLDANQHLIFLRVTDNSGLQSEVGATIIIEQVTVLDDWPLGLQTTQEFMDVSIYNTAGKLVYHIKELPPQRRLAVGFERPIW